MTFSATCLTPIKGQDRTVVDHWTWLEQQGLIEIEYIEFHVPKQLYRILAGRERTSLRRVARNVARIFRLLTRPGALLILGVEPFSLATLMINRLKRQNRCIYWTTWSWSEERFHDRTLVPLRDQLWRVFLKDLICVASTPLAAQALTAFGARARYIPHPVDSEVFCPAVEKTAHGNVKVLFVGELERIKGVHLVVEMLKSREWPHIEFWFAGRGPLQGEIQRLIACGKPVKYLGRISGKQQMVETYQAADMLILPSIKIGRNEEKFGMVLTEAMACGIPVIASDCIGPRQVVEHEKNGLLIPQNDVKALTAAIQRLAASPDLRARMGAYGRKQAEDIYDKRVVAGKWLEVIRQAVTDGQDCSTSGAWRE